MNNKTYLTPLLEKSCKELAEEFFQLKSPRDVAELLEIPYKYLVYYIYRMPHDRKYTKFSIPKKSGDFRIIYSPKNSLGIIQRKLSQVLYAIYKPRPSVHGFAVSRSIITNAKAHAKKSFVFNLDIKDFFDSINFGRVRGMFIANPYKLNKEVATILAQICCYENKLPQGAPTSPIISNLICAKMDSELQRFCKEYGLLYTRYADDITISSNRRELPTALVASYIKGLPNVVIGDELRLIIEKNNGFQINESKVRLLYKTQRQEVTGLIVNQGVNIDRKYIRNLDAALHAWERYGLVAAVEMYQNKYAKQSTLPHKKSSDFIEHLRGKIEFIGSIRGKEDYIYQKLLNKFNCLKNKKDDIEN